MMETINKNGYKINLEMESITTPVGYELTRDTLSNVNNLYERLCTTNRILDMYANENISNSEAWNLACKVRDEMEEYPSHEDDVIEDIVEEYLENRDGIDYEQE